MDSLAAIVDATLEEEELVADQLKEYLFFGTSVQAVCKRRDLLQLQLQKAQELISNRLHEMEQVQRGNINC